MTTKNRKTYKLALIAVFSALMCIASPFCIPTGAVAITVSLFFVFLTGLFLPPAQAFLSQLIYVLLGAVGLPVFSGFTGSVSVILSFSGGFILAYPIVSFAVSAVSRLSDKKYILPLSLFIGMLILYTLGSLWYMYIAKAGFKTALIAAVLPFIAVDIVKAVCAVIVFGAIKKRIKH